MSAEHVPTPGVDPLHIDSDATVSIRGRSDLLYGIMQMRDCSFPEAERYLANNGQEQVERELRARLQSTKWGGRE
jgi:hypothetical protein